MGGVLGSAPPAGSSDPTDPVSEKPTETDSRRLVVMILQRERAIEKVLERLYEMGVRATVLRAQGMKDALQEDIPLFTGLAAGLARGPSHHRMVFSVIDDPELLERAIATVVEVCEEYEGERTGVVFTLPVDHYQHL